MSSQEPAERWLSVQEAADELGKSPRTLYRWIDKGEIEHRREGRRVYVNVVDRVAPERKDVLDTSDIEGLRFEVVKLRAQVDKLSALYDNVVAERDYLRLAHAEALRLSRPAIQEPKEGRSWWQFWRSDD